MGEAFLGQHPKSKNEQAGNSGHVDPLLETARLDEIGILLKQSGSFFVVVSN